MAFYQPGDVVSCYFPFDDKAVAKLRPGLVIGIDSETIYVVSKITSKDRSKNYPGEIIPAGSELQKIMGLDQESFINMGNIKRLPKTMIKDKIGVYELWEDFEEKFKEYIPR
ncbi:MAG: type II toxin-antitoxin system PemK/MazF family toxin [Bacteroidales bacterium]|jgi:hypothetical protein|nr:type II toxin-antitoxin system PemK/MazF family toxin [Bacteroidales bacterium]